jgi:lysophospholipase L1-like esterase
LVVVGGIDVPLWGRGYGNAYKELCKEAGCVLIPDILEGILGNGNLMSDPIHPNGAGYGIVAQRFFEAIKPYLNTN